MRKATLALFISASLILALWATFINRPRPTHPDDPYFSGLMALANNDYDAAEKILRPLAENGNADAQRSFGSMYLEGKGVPQDNAEATKWYRSSAEQGNTAAQRGLGAMYARGLGVPQNYTEAVRWFRLAAEGANSGGLDAYSEAAKAQYALGYMYDNGQGVPHDEVEALKWYRLAAEHGSADAQSVLGSMHVHGKGVSQDYAEAATWYRLAADQGNVLAQSQLGLLYAYGRGVPQDFVQAHKWFNLASAQLSGSETKRRETIDEFRNNVEAKMSQAQIAEAQRLAQEWRPQGEGCNSLRQGCASTPSSPRRAE